MICILPQHTVKTSCAPQSLFSQNTANDMNDYNNDFRPAPRVARMKHTLAQTHDGEEIAAAPVASSTWTPTFFGVTNAQHDTQQSRMMTVIVVKNPTLPRSQSCWANNEAFVIGRR